MSKQIVAKNFAAQPIPANQKTTIKIAKGQHLRVQDIVQNQAKEAGNVVATKQGQDLHLQFADGAEVRIEGFYNQCTGNACSVTVAGNHPGGYTINGDTAIGNVTSNGGHLVYAYGEQSSLMSLAMGDSGMAGALGNLGNGIVAYVPVADGLSMGWVGSLVAAGVGLAVASKDGTQAAANAPSITSVTDNVGSITGAVANNGTTDDTDVLVRISLGSNNAVAGDSVRLYEGPNTLGSVVTLTAQDITNGYIDIQSGTLTTGNTYALSAKITDLAGNVSNAATAHSITVTTSVPSGGGASSVVASINSIAAFVVGGPVLSGNDLKAIIYAANGTTALGEGTVNANGSVTIQVGSYTGVVIVKVISMGANPDYMDESTGVATDLANTVLHSVGEIVTQNGITTLNVNVLTSLVYLKAVQIAGVGQTLSSQIVANTNAAVADAFGLTNLLGESVVTTVNTSGNSNTAYDASNGLSNAEKYGALLAALSGADSGNGGNAQTTINNLAANLTVSGSSGSLNSTAINTIIAGAQTADPSNSQTLVLAASNATTQTAASLIINSVATDNVVNATETGATVAGTAAANASISLTLGNGNTQNVTADSQGLWSYSLQPADIAAMGQGPETISVSDGTNTSTRGVFVDTTIPTVSVAASTTTNAGASTVAVTSNEAGVVYLVSSSVTVTNLASITGAGNALVASAVAAANSASGISTVGLTAGTYHAYARDAAGNLSLISTNAVTVVAASGAAISGVALSVDSGSSATDFITNVQTQTISGNLSVAPTGNERVEISLDNGATWATATVTGTTFSLSNADLSNGTNRDYNDTLQVRVFNAGLNGQAGTSYSHSYVYDRTAVNRPDFEVALDDVAPLVLAINNLNNLSVMPGNPAVTDDNRPELKLAFRGGAFAGDILRIYDTLGGNTTQIGTHTLTATDVRISYFLFQAPQLADGLHSFSADTADLAGNASSTTASFDFFINTSGATPSVPAISSSTALTSNSPIVTGSASPGHLVTVNVGGATFVTTTAANGTWSINTATATPANGTFAPLSPGISPLSVTVTGANGSTSAAASQGLNFSQGVASVSFSNDTGSSSTDFITSNASQTISGTVVMNLSATESVEVSLNNGSTWTTATTTTGQNTYSLAAQTLGGSNTLQVRVVDNGTPGSVFSQVYVLDSSAPNAPSVTSVTDNVGSITGAVANNGSTDDTDVLVRVTLGSNNAVAGDSVLLYEGANALGSAATLLAQDITNGYIDIQSGTLTTGNSYALSAKITDIAGNISNAATAHNITVDTSVPAIPVITSSTLSNSATPTLGGTALSGSTVTVTVGGATYTTTATGGNWSVNLSSATPASGTLSLNANGGNAVSATATNIAGTSSAAASQTLAIDTTAPTVSLVAATIVPVGNASVTASEAGTVYLVHASITPTSVTDITNASGALWNSVSVSANTATNLSATGLNLGSYYAYAADAAGNLSPISSNAITVEVGPLSVAFSADTGSSASDFITLTAAQTITGTLSENIQAGDVVEISLDNGGTWTPASTTVGQNTYSLSGVTLAGSGTLQVHLTRNAVTSSPLTQAYVLDGAAPNAPTITSVTDNVSSVTGAVANNGSTDDTDVLVRITLGSNNAVAGDSLRLYEGANTLGSSVTLVAQDITNGYIDIQSGTLTTGSTYALSAKITDIAGNVSNAATAHTITVDTSVPATPVITSSALSNLATPTLSGTALSGSTVTVTVGGATYTTTATGGNWSVNMSSATPASGTLSLNANGGNAVSATATNIAGTSSAAASQTLVIDTTTPNAPTITSVTDNVGGITGVVVNNGITDDTDVLVRVTLGSNNALAGDSIRLYEGANTLGSVVTLVAQDITNGYIDIQSGTLTTGNAYTLSAKITDLAGNVSNAATAHTITVDTSVPAIPVITSSSLSNNATPTLSGTALSGSTVTVTVGGATYTTTATGGNWSVNLSSATPASGTLSLNANGSNAVSATATNVAGTSSAAASQTLVIDTTAPNAPSITSVTDNVGSITGAVANNGSTDDTDVLVRVTLGSNNAVAGDSVHLYEGANALGSAVTLVAQDITNGYIDIQSGTLTTGNSYALSAKITDIAGNVSNAATAHNITADTSVPTVAIASATLSNSTTPTVSGTATSGSTVSVTIGNAVYTVVATGGTWSVNTASATPTSYTSGSSLSLNTNGNNAVTASVLSVSGVTGASTPSQTLAIDTTAPTVSLVAATIVPAGNASVTASEAGTVYLVHASITPTSVTDITNASGALWNSVSVSANTATNLSATGLNLGSYYAYAADAAGNLSPVSSNAIAVEVGPLSVAFSADTGSSASDFITLTAAQTITGTLSENIQTGDVVEVSLDNGGTWTPASTTVGQNTYSLSGVTLAGSGTLQVHLTRNAVTSSPLTQAYVLDTTVPNAPTLTSVTDNAGSVTGTVANNTSTDDTDVLVRVTLGSNNAVAGDSLRLYEGANTLGSAVTLVAQDISNGYIDIQSGTLTTGNTYALSAKITDIAGNISSAATAHTITVDTTAPVVAITSAALSNSPTPTVSGTATSGATVSVTIGNAVYTVTATGGTWSVNTAAATPTSYTSGSSLSLNTNGNNTVTASAVNSLGISSASTPSQTLVIDTTAPNAPTLTSVTDNVGSITGAVTNNGSTDDTDVLVRISLGSNNAVAGDSVRLYEGANALGSAVTLLAQDITNGYIDIQSGTLSTGNTYALNAKITDLAGNVSNAATAHNITVDTSVPVVAIASAALSNSATPTVSGTATSGATVSVTIGNAIYTVTATGGTWSVNTTSATPTSYTSGSSLSLNANGNNTVTVSVLSVAGVSGASTPSQTLVIDTTAPNAPSITSVTDNVGSITGAVANNGSTDDTDVLVRVTLGSNNAVAGDSVRLYEGANALGSAVTLVAQDITNGYVTIQSGTLTTGNTYALSAKITDLAGNVSNAATAHNITVDTTAPNAPTIASITDAVGAVTGVVSAGGMTDDTAAVIRVNLSNNAVAGDSMHLYNGANAFGSAYTLLANDISAGYVDITPSNGALVSGNTYTLTATLADAVGNVSSASSAYGLVVDTSAPGAPAITSAASSTSATPTISGTATAGVSIILTIGGATFSTTANGSGQWSINTGVATPTSGSLSLNTSGTPNSLSVVATNQNGVSSTSATQNLVIDAQAPTVILTTASIDNSQNVTVESDEAGTVYFVNGSVTVTNVNSITSAAGQYWNSASATANTPFSLAASGLADGTYHAYAVDAAGNLSQVSQNAVTINSPVQVLTYSYQAYYQNNSQATGNYIPADGYALITAQLSKQVHLDLGNGSFPQLQLSVDGTTVTIDLDAYNSIYDTNADYTPDNGAYSTLIFKYSLQSWPYNGEQDSTGISILANINGNNGVFEAASTTTSISSIQSVAITDISTLKIDTIAPNLIEVSSTPNDVTLQSNEVGSFYLIDSSVSSFAFDSFIANPNNSTFWKQLPVGAVNTNATISFSGLDDGSYLAYARDEAGNWSQASTSTFTFDNNAPVIRSVSLDNQGSSPYIVSQSGWNNVVYGKITFSEVIALDSTSTPATASPTIDINIGGVNYTANITGTGGRDAFFSYTSNGSENDTDGVSIDAQSLVLNGNVFRDGSGNALSSASISAMAADPTVLVDNQGPQVTSVSISAAGGQSGYLNAGDVVSITVNFDVNAYDKNFENRSAYGSSINLNIGGILRTATAVSGNGTRQFTFNYTIQGIDIDVNGISVNANSLATGYNFTTGKDQDITDQAYGQGLVAGQNLAVADISTLQVDNTAPTVSAVAFTGTTGAQNNYLNAGDTATFSVTLNEAVALDTTSGTPRLKLNIGGATVYASYVPGSSTSTVLAFSYTILNLQTDSNGIAVFQDGFELNGATLADLAGNTATITHAAVSDNASYMVDTTAPNVPTVTSATFNSTAARIIGGTLSGGLGTNTMDVTVNSATYTLASGNFTSNNWSLNLDTATPSSGTLGAWADGSYNVAVHVTDPAGNTSQDSSNNELTFQTALPTAPAILSIADNIGSITGAVANSGVSDDRNPMIRINLTGTNAQVGDKLKLYNGNTVLGSYQYPLDSQDISTGYVDMNTGWLTTAGTLDSGARYSFVSGNLTDQYYDFNVKLIDTWGNVSGASNTHQVLVDTQPPTATIVTTLVQRLGTANTISGHDIQVQSTEQGSLYLIPESVSISSLSSITSYIANGANANTWKSTSVATANTNITLNLDNLHNGGYHLYAVDQAGNISVRSTNYVSIYTPADLSIYLGPTNGFLIAPHQDTSDGEWFYHWDKSGNRAADSADQMTLSSLHPWLSYDSSMTTASGDIDATNRYGAISEVEVAMAQYGSTGSLTFNSSAGAFQWSVQSPSSAFSDLVNVFAPYSVHSTNWLWSEGKPPDWLERYWTATEVTVAGSGGQTVGENLYASRISVLYTASNYPGNTEANLNLGVAVAVL